MSAAFLNYFDAKPAPMVWDSPATDKEVSARIDPLLLPLIDATDEVEIQSILDHLVSTHARPIIQGIVPHKLRIAFDSSAPRWLDAEDVQSEVLVRLLKRLREFKADPGENAIEDVRGYIAVVAYHACDLALRQKFPQRARLKNRVRYLLSHRRQFALWEWQGKWLGGMAEWRGSQAAKDPMPRLRQFCADPPRSARWASEEDKQGPTYLSTLLQAIFRFARGSVELDHLVNVIAEVTQCYEQESGHVLEREIGEVEARIADRGLPLTTLLDHRNYLNRLWSEILLLPRRQRLALLLNLRDNRGNSVTPLLPATGIASIRAIAEALEITPGHMAELWNRLPLSDLQIADLLGITRQKVINLRKSGRDRLARRMRGLGL